MKWVFDKKLGRQVWVERDFNKAYGERKLRETIRHQMLPFSPVSAIVHNPSDAYNTSLLVSNKYGVYELVIKNGRIIQNHIREILQDMEVKYMQHERGDAFLIYPKWSKKIIRLNINARDSITKGITTLFEIEWTKGSVPVTGLNPDRANWHVGFSGNTIFLNEMKDERSYVLKTDLHFNYWCDIQIVQEDKKYLKYKVFYVEFDQEKYCDTICMSRMHL